MLGPRDDRPMAGSVRAAARHPERAAAAAAGADASARIAVEADRLDLMQLDLRSPSGRVEARG